MSCFNKLKHHPLFILCCSKKQEILNLLLLHYTSAPLYKSYVNCNWHIHVPVFVSQINLKVFFIYQFGLVRKNVTTYFISELENWIWFSCCARDFYVIYFGFQLFQEDFFKIDFSFSICVGVELSASEILWWFGNIYFLWFFQYLSLDFSRFLKQLFLL